MKNKPEEDALFPQGIAASLPTAYQSLPITVYKTVDSTNLAAKRAALAGAPTGSLFVAEAQTAGRGRQGKTFFSPQRQGIYMSLLLRPQMPLDQAVLFTTAASVGVARAIAQQTGIETQIKWVNDLYCQGKKVCGILTEGVTHPETGQMESIILGVGINIRGGQEDFPPQLWETVGTLFGKEPSPVDRNQLIGAITGELLDLFAQLEAGEQSFWQEYRSRSLLLGCPIWVIQGEKRERAIALDIDPWGGLIIEDANGRRTLTSGEVSIRLAEV